MTVSEQIIQVIDALCEKFGIAINWTSENVIPYIEVLCRKLITYEVATSIAWAVFDILILIAAAILIKKAGPKVIKGAFYEEEVGWIFTFVFGGIGTGIAIVCALIDIGFQVGDIIKCLTFPEMYVFEYVSDLIQGA